MKSMMMMMLCAVSAAVSAETITLAWDASTPAGSVAGYEIRYGETPGAATFVHDAGNVLVTTIEGTPQAGKTYYFRARAYNSGKTVFSADSNEVSHTFVLVLQAPINLRVVP